MNDSALTTASTEMKWINGWSAAATFDASSSTPPQAMPAVAWCGIRGKPATSVPGTFRT
jgi:hypothetical protein